MNNLAKNLTSISISKTLSDKIKEKIKGTPFNSVSSYITFIMRLIILESYNNKENKKELSEDITSKLKKLGYL